MRKIRRSILLLVAFAAFAHAEATGGNPFLHTVGADGTLRFELTERIKHPHFWWPRTLLNYHIILAGPSALPDRWSLADGKLAQPLPMQVSDVRREDGRIVAATVSFFSDLPTGGHRSFLLHTGAPEARAARSEQADIVREASGIVLDTGALKVRIPNSQEIEEGKTAPGPILAVNDGKGWVGESSLDSPKKHVRKITTQILDRGSLFARVRVIYDFEGGARYTATIKAPRDYCFVEFTEEFSGLTVEDKAVFHFLWTGVPLTHRAGGEPIDKARILYYRGEDPHFTGPGGVENPAENFYFRVGHCAGDSTILRTSADFSNPETGRAIGLCVLDGSWWDDGAYAIWASSDAISVRFRYRDKRLEWMLPLAGKSRQLGIAAYDLKDAKNARMLAQFSAYSDLATERTSIANRGVADGKDLVSFINSRYGGMSLDSVKDWQLAYPEAGAKPATHPLPPKDNFRKTLENLDAYTKAIWGDHEALHVEGNWFSPVSMRQMNQWVVPGFNKFRDAITPEMRDRVTALLLFQSYLAAREEISPIRHMLKGHPNFMTDWKYPLMAGAWLFPDHPMAHEWADQWGKFVELAGVFYVRPEVKAWEAKGGRWTENIGTYNWAFIEPATKANELGLLFDGRDRLASAGMALHGEYLSGIVTAPVKLGKDGKPFDFTPGTALTPNNGFQRIHPPQGAHSSRRAVPGCVESLANSLKNYAPMTAERLLWVNRRPVGTPTGFEGESTLATVDTQAQGTNPRLRSAKYTGYGIVLRAAVDTPDEIAIYLQQVDKGPNYRWGFGNENGGGDIYYYAGGNSYAGHLSEDAGDRHGVDAEVTCNTGVFKDSTFRGIGMNDLTEPIYDLGGAQFAEILARPGADAYSWPEYEARSVMLVGHEYIVVYDTVNLGSRFAWNTVKGQDKMPTIISIRGENSYRSTQVSVAEGHPDICSESARLEPYKGDGDRMTLVSHRGDVKVAPVHRKAEKTFTEVVLPEGRDFIYQQRAPFVSEENGRVFAGRAGVIREFTDGRRELALFKGDRIGTRELQLAVDNPNLGVSAAFKTPSEVAGEFSSRAGGKLTLTLPLAVANAVRLFVNGTSVEQTSRLCPEYKQTPITSGAPVSRLGSSFTIVAQLPRGEGYWQLTTGPAVPLAPEITHTVARTDGAAVFFTAVPSASSYRIESSHDGGVTWTAAGTSKTNEFVLGGIAPPEKVHLRVIALNGESPSLSCMDYPVAVTGKPAGPPEGLRLGLARDEATARWGAVLGAKEYVLYRRKAGQLDWKEIFRGADCLYHDRVEGIVPAARDPGLQADAERQPKAEPVVYEYAVSAVDGVGESDKSKTANTDPTSWRNWYPDTQLQFKRRSAYWLPPYVKPEQVPPATYPE